MREKFFTDKAEKVRVTSQPKLESWQKYMGTDSMRTQRRPPMASLGCVAKASNMHQQFFFWGFIAAFIGVALFGQCLLAQSQTPYDLPNDDNGCPDNCRQVPWQAGSDLWNGGTLPTYTQDSPCAGLVGGGSTDNTVAINACISAASSGHAVYIPAGVYLVAGTINMKSNVVLRGAKPAGAPYLPATDTSATTLVFGAKGQIYFVGNYSAPSTDISVSGAANKGSTTLTLAAGHGLVQNDWIVISESDNLNTALVAQGGCTWCGWRGSSTPYHLMVQIAQVTAVSGNVIALSRPLYYTFAYSPVVGKIGSFSTAKAGIENMRLDGSAYDHTLYGGFILMRNSLYNWAKGVETYDAGSSIKNFHVTLEWSYGCEIRDSYFHDGRGSSSDHNYGVWIFRAGSDHKIENNILRHLRHGVAFEGGGSGVAFLYNYIDDDYTDDLTYLGNATSDHGPHPFMNLFEGNVISHIVADNVWGSSSHNVWFRNWLWGDETGTGVPSWPPSGGFNAIDVTAGSTYYSYVGNVLGLPASYWGGSYTNHAVWTAASVRANSEWSSRSGPTVYSYGGPLGSIPSADSTSLNHGNYDYKTLGVAFWEGGSNHMLKQSMYYGLKPPFFGHCSWPVFGPDLAPITNMLPAKARFEGDSSCSAISGAPAAPTALRATVN